MKSEYGWQTFSFLFLAIQQQQPVVKCAVCINLGGTWGLTVKARHVLSLALEATLHAPTQTGQPEPLA